MPPEGNRELSDLVLELTAESSNLAGMLHPRLQSSVGDLVRSMNCYYSNFIEGHNTHPRDIDRALADDYSNEPTKRSLQKEAVAHIQVQKMIDEDKDIKAEATSREYILWLHREFCERLPSDLLWVESQSGKNRIQVVPGQLRDGKVTVGRHLPPEPQSLEGFLKRLEEAYSAANLSKTAQVISAGAAHHRFLWIHPFFDGNGRVARLMSYTMLKRLGIGSPLWSVARGLARTVSEYRRLLENADEQRQNDYDGRGTLSERALIDFCRYFLKVCIDQIIYMKSLLQPSDLLNRMKVFVDEQIIAGRLAKGSFELLREAVHSGEYDRGQAAAITGFSDRHARRVLSTLVERKLLRSDGPKLPVRLGLPTDIVERWFPLLYPAAGV